MNRRNRLVGHHAVPMSSGQSLIESHLKALSALLFAVIAGSLLTNLSAQGQTTSYARQAHVITANPGVAVEAGTPMSAASSVAETRRTSVPPGAIGQVPSVEEVPALGRTITLQLRGVKLERALKRIAAKAGLSIAYLRETAATGKKVTLKVEAISAQAALQTTLRGTDLRLVSTLGPQLVLVSQPGLRRTTPRSPSVRKIQAALPTARRAEEPMQGTISGTAIDSSSGEPIPGVNVLVEGTQLGTATGSDGTYEITDVEPGTYTVTASYIGYEDESKEGVVVEEGQTTSIDFALQQQAQGLEEVVVVGYQTQERENVTGSISTIDVGETLDNRPITNASQALSGKAAGVWASQNSGKPGSDAAQIRIRGWGTMNNSEPLVLIDGVEGSFDEVNPQDIKIISVLKDAASAAIYGSKAANGVVLITTKEGQYGQDLQINFSSYAGVQELGKHYDMVNSSARYMELWNEALTNGGSEPLYSDELISEFRNSNNSYQYPSTDWYDELFRTAAIQEHNVSLRGGSENISAYMSINYQDQGGIIRNTDSEEYGVRVNLSSKPTSWLDLGAKLHYRNQGSTEPYRLFRSWTLLHAAVPFIAPYTEEGEFGSVQAFDDDGNMLYDNRNPLIDNNNGSTDADERIMNADLNSTLKLSDNLRMNTKLASHVTNTLTERWNQSLYGYTSGGQRTITKNYNREGVERIREAVRVNDLSVYNTIDYSDQFGSIHSLSVLGGVEYKNTTIKDQRARSMNPAKESLTQVDAGTGGWQASGNLGGVRTLSYFGRVNYSIADRYILVANIRRDGSSRFGEDNRWGTFPGVSLGWRVGEENFMDNLDFVSNLKLTASWGRLGNQNIGGYWPYLTTINQSLGLSYSYNEAFAPGMAITSLVDEGVTWESTTTRDVGFELGLFANKVSLKGNYFIKTTEDIIVQLPIPQLLGGVTPPYENEGMMQNNGFEFSFGYDNVLSSNRDQFDVSLDANLTYTKNEVTKFRGGDSPDQYYLIREGYPFNSLYGYRVEGIYQSDQEAEEHMNANSFKPEAGDLKYQDVNGDGRLDYQDKQMLGNTIPVWTFGFTPTFSFKGFDLSMLIGGAADVSVDIRSNATTVTQDNATIHSMWRNAWTPENTDTDIPRLTVNSTWNTRDSGFWVRNASFVKLRNIQLGYDLPPSLLSNLGVQEAYIYANAQNVYTWANDDYLGFNPERNTFNSGADVYPVPRMYTVGVNLGF